MPLECFLKPMVYQPIFYGDSMAEDFKLPFDPSILMEYINSNAMMIAIILLVTIVTLVGFAKLKHSIVPVGIAIIAACQVVQVIQMVYPQ